jgi:hypothetical protein
MGRPPIGKVAMTATERWHRFRAKQRAGQGQTKPQTKHSPADTAVAEIAALKQQLTQAHKRIAELERRSEGQLTRSSRREGIEFGEVGKLRAEITKLKSDILKLKAALQEEPDMAKLRKKVVDQQVEMASMRREIKRLAKERDKYRTSTQPKFREASRLLTRQNYRLIVKALHSDRAKLVTPDELATAERVATALGPLFESH